MSWNGINARLFNLAWGLHELCTVWRCFTSPAALNAHNHLYADSCPPLSSVAPKHPIDSEVHSRGVCVCVCTCAHACVFRVFSANTNHSALQPNMNVPAACSLHPTQSCCRQCHGVNAHSVICLFHVISPQLNQAGSK